MKSKPARGLQDIHTMSERVSEVDNPQRKYLTLAMLELEKVRRNKVRQSASQRIESIDRRVAEIEEEQAALLAAAEAELAESSLTGGPHKLADPGSPNEQGFRLAY